MADMAMDFVPGTRQLYTADDYADNLAKHGDVVLVPQPTGSPNDPLNWSLARKLWHTLLVCFVVGLTAATANSAGSGADGVNEDYGISYDTFNTGAGVLFVGIGSWALLSSPAVYLYGRRLLYLIGMIWGLTGNIWYARIQTTSDAVWSQLFVGASEAVAEASVQLSLLDIWFEHQNGTILGLYTLATAVGTYLGPLVAGYIADSDLGWRWVGWLGAISSGFAFVLLYFGLEETEFCRDRHSYNQQQHWSRQKQMQEASASKHQTVAHASPAEAGLVTDAKRTYWKRIRVITPAPNLRGWGFRQYMMRLLHTLRVFFLPAVWYAGLQWGLQSSMLTFYLTVEDTTWYGPPWNYGDAQVANMNIPCIIGSVIGCFYGGYLSDRFLLCMARRNGGIVEPEFRLYLNLLCAVVLPLGLVLFGIGSGTGWDWPAPFVALALVGFGYGCAGDLSITYLADSYPDMVLEGMVGVAVINNAMGCIFSFVASSWVDAQGVVRTFVAIGIISWGILMLTVPMIAYGKRMRRWSGARYMRCPRQPGAIALVEQPCRREQ